MKNLAIVGLLLVAIGLLGVIAIRIPRATPKPQPGVSSVSTPSASAPAAPEQPEPSRPSSSATSVENVASQTEAPVGTGQASPNSAAQVRPTLPTGWVPLRLNLPAAGFTGTPTDIVLSSYVEPLTDKPREPILVPPGLTNLAPGAALSSSDKNASLEMLAQIVDGDKEPNGESIILIRKGTQWVQLDLGASHELFAIVLWHAHNTAKVYYDVIVLASDDPGFATGVRTLYNNDQDNTSNLGAGTDREYFETREGRLINPKGARARYLRFYSKGSTESSLNEYTEIEVYGRP